MNVGWEDVGELLVLCHEQRMVDGDDKIMISGCSIERHGMRKSRSFSRSKTHDFNRRQCIFENGSRHPGC